MECRKDDTAGGNAEEDKSADVFALIGGYGLGLSHRVLWLRGDAFVIFQGFVGQVDGFF